MSDMTILWRNAFATWPENFRRKGVVVPVYGEAIPFSDFVMSETMVILERPTPDNTGARRVALPFERIHNLKYTEPLKTEQFLKAGFVKEMSEVAEPRSPQTQPPIQAVAPVVAVQAAPAQQQPAIPQPAVQQQVMHSPPPSVAPQPAVPQQVPAAVLSQQQVPAASQPYQQAVAQPMPAGSVAPQPTPEQIQEAILQRQLLQQQQMQTQAAAANQY